MQFTAFADIATDLVSNIGSSFETAFDKFATAGMTSPFIGTMLDIGGLAVVTGPSGSGKSKMIGRPSVKEALADPKAGVVIYSISLDPSQHPEMLEARAAGRLIHIGQTSSPEVAVQNIEKALEHLDNSGYPVALLLVETVELLSSKFEALEAAYDHWVTQKNGTVILECQAPERFSFTAEYSQVPLDFSHLLDNARHFFAFQYQADPKSLKYLEGELTIKVPPTIVLGTSSTINISAHLLRRRWKVRYN